MGLYRFGMEDTVWSIPYGILINLFQERLPQLSYQISEEWFDENLADQKDFFDLVENDEGAFYVRNIAENDLEANFDPETDGKSTGFFSLF